MQALASPPLLEGDGLAERTVSQGGIECLSRTFEEQLRAFRQVDRVLARVDRHITSSRGDRSLQAFWRGVKRDFEKEADRRALRVGAEAIRLSGIDDWADWDRGPRSQPCLVRA
jgi:hypothetical protein